MKQKLKNVFEASFKTPKIVMSLYLGLYMRLSTDWSTLQTQKRLYVRVIIQTS